MLGGSPDPKPAVPPAGEPRPPTPDSPAGETTQAAPAAAAGPALTPLPRPGWVEVLLTNGAAEIPYPVLHAQPVGRDVVDVLLKRFDELPALPFRNKLGIAQALADVGGLPGGGPVPAGALRGIPGAVPDP